MMTVAGSHREGSPGTPAQLRQHNGRWVAILTCAVVVTGMAYSLWWPALVRHTPGYWTYPFDLFGTVQAAHWIEYGAFQYLYNDSSNGILTLPGFAILMVPIVALSDALHLLTTSSAFPVLKPTQWLLLGPLTMATSAVALAGLDSLARSIGVPIVRRRVMLVCEAAAVWGAIVRWGHPEDVIALGLSAWALSRSLEGRTSSAGWLLGVAISMQLYVVLLIPIFIGLLGRRRSVGLLLRAALLPGAIFLALLIPNTDQTLHVLLDQPTQPHVNHPTPWVLVSPHLGSGEVAGGPARIVGLVGACLLGVLASRYRNHALMVVWLFVAALALRCLTEAVMTPYYVAPAIAFALLAVAPRSWPRWLLVIAAAAALTVLTYYRTGIWWYWFEMAVTLATMLIATWSSPSSATTLEPDTVVYSAHHVVSPASSASGTLLPSMSTPRATTQQ